MACRAEIQSMFSKVNLYSSYFHDEYTPPPLYLQFDPACKVSPFLECICWS